MLKDAKNLRNLYKHGVSAFFLFLSQPLMQKWLLCSSIAYQENLKFQKLYDYCIYKYTNSLTHAKIFPIQFFYCHDFIFKKMLKQSVPPSCLISTIIFRR